MKCSGNKFNLICILTLIFIGILVFFTNMSSYAFIDTDETKFVSIAKNMLNNSDWINIKDSTENLFNFSPFYFWLVNLSCVFFGKISTDVVRFPISIAAITGVLLLYLSIKSILTKVYAFIISLIFISSLGIIIFARLATNDMLYLVFSMTAILFGYLSILLNKKKPVFAFLMYIFISFAVMTTGLFGFIPLIAIIIMNIFSGELKNMLKPLNIIPGLLTLLILVFPWHFFMYLKHGSVFINEFLDAYNIFKYSSLKKSLEVLLLFAIGFFPWIFSFLWILGHRFKGIYNSIISYLKDDSQDKLHEKWCKLKRIEKFLSLNTIAFFTGLIFALIYGGKYTFLILFLIFPASCISGHYWYEYIVKIKHRKSIFFATMIPNLIMIACSLIALFGHNILNKWLFQGLYHLLIPLIIIFFAIPVVSIFAVLVKGKKVPFSSNIILMVSLSFVITPSIFNFIMLNGGENDLITYAMQASKDKAPLAANISSKKYSIEYYYDKPVNFLDNPNIIEFKEFLKQNPDTYVIVELKDMLNIDENTKEYMLLDSGKRYCLIQYSPTIKLEQEEEGIETGEDV